MSTIVKQEFAVDGMSCGGCVKSVTRSLSQLPGVLKVDVSLERKAATIESDGAAIKPAAIVAAIEATGFGASAAVRANGRSRSQTTQHVAMKPGN